MTLRLLAAASAVVLQLVAISPVPAQDIPAPPVKRAVQHAMPAGGYYGTVSRPILPVRMVYSGPRRFGETRISEAQCAALGGQAHVPAATDSPCASGLACTVAPAFARERTVCLAPATVTTLATN